MSRLRQALVLFALGLLAASRGSCGTDVFADTTAGRARTITPEYFGIHFHRLVLRPNENAVRTAWPDARFGSVRLWDSTTRWGDIAAKAGQWDWERLDAYVGMASARNASILYTLGSTPRWASARPDERCSYGFGCAAEPVRLAHWEEYVRRVAQRYRGLIGAFELWNEPYFSDIERDRGQPAFYSGSVVSMVEMARVARRVLDESSPDVPLATPGFVNGADRLELFLAAGGKAYVQAVAYHFYSTDPEDFMRRIAEVRQVMRRQGVENLPLWNTELGVEVYEENSPLPPGVPRRLTRREAAARMVQYLVLGAVAGLDRFYYYAWDNDHSGMVTRGGERLPAYEAMLRVQDWLIGARTRGCVSPGKGLVSCRLEAGDQETLIAWADRPGEYWLQVPDGMQAVMVETLLSDARKPVWNGQRGKLKISLAAEPIRVVLDRQRPQ